MTYGTESRLAPSRASMKALPKKKGNLAPERLTLILDRLNESPSEKEGKCPATSL